MFISLIRQFFSCIRSCGTTVLVCAGVWFSLRSVAANLILNGGFESGSASWTLQESTVTNSGGYSHSGTYYLQIFPAPYNGHQGFGYQTITIPTNVTAATLS